MRKFATKNFQKSPNLVTLVSRYKSTPKIHFKWVEKRISSSSRFEKNRQLERAQFVSNQRTNEGWKVLQNCRQDLLPLCLSLLNLAPNQTENTRHFALQRLLALRYAHTFFASPPKTLFNINKQNTKSGIPLSIAISLSFSLFPSHTLFLPLSPSLALSLQH